MTEWVDWAVALGVALLGGGLITGVAALRRSGKEADKYAAEASHMLVGASGEVVRLLREEVTDMNKRLCHLEAVVGDWEGWSDDVIALLDQAVSMLSSEHASQLQAEIDKVKERRPSRHRHL